MNLWQITIPTPLGELRALASSNGLCLLDFQEDNNPANKFSLTPDALLAKIECQYPKHTIIQSTNAILDQTQIWISRYFSGDYPNEVSIPPLDIQGTPFCERTWRALCTVAPRQTRSYQWLAQQIGRPTAARAVGKWVGLNPIVLIIPCHRILGSNGALTGFRSGLWRKEWLLAHEQQ